MRSPKQLINLHSNLTTMQRLQTLSYYIYKPPQHIHKHFPQMHKQQLTTHEMSPSTSTTFLHIHRLPAHSLPTQSHDTSIRQQSPLSHCHDTVTNPHDTFTSFHTLNKFTTHSHADAIISDTWLSQGSPWRLSLSATSTAGACSCWLCPQHLPSLGRLVWICELCLATHLRFPAAEVATQMRRRGPDSNTGQVTLS